MHVWKLQARICILKECADIAKPIGAKYIQTWFWICGELIIMTTRLYSLLSEHAWCLYMFGRTLSNKTFEICIWHLNALQVWKVFEKGVFNQSEHAKSDVIPCQSQPYFFCRQIQLTACRIADCCTGFIERLIGR